MAMQTREQLMRLAADAFASAAFRLHASGSDGYERLEPFFQQLALSSADGSLSDEGFLSRWEVFMSSAEGVNATDPRPRPSHE